MIDKPKIFIVLIAATIAATLIAYLYSNTSPTSEPIYLPPTQDTTSYSDVKKRSVWDDGTFEIGKDIAVGKYKSIGDGCYWSISNDANNTKFVSSGFQDGQQIIELNTVGQFLTLSNCQFKSY